MRPGIKLRKQAITGPTAQRLSYPARECYPLVIGGEEVETPDYFSVVDPSLGREWTRVAHATRDDVDSAVTTAASAVREFRATAPSIRQRYLLDIADVIEARVDDWERVQPGENGRPMREVRPGDVPVAAGIFRYFAGLARDGRGDTIPTDDGVSHVYTRREPLGVIAALIPWNSPLITSAQKIAPALAMGNTMVLKPSEFASVTVLELALSLGEALPPGVVNVVTGDGADVGAHLVAHPGIAKISFTGGTSTARKIMAAAATQLTPSLMELGGKGALVICDDADLDAAVQDALLGIFRANGEVCFAASRLLVQGGIYDDFMERYASIAQTIRVGDALDPETQLGPLISAGHRSRVLDHVDRAVKQGAHVVLGGSERSLSGDLQGGFYVDPTILEDPDGSSDITLREVFGPVAVVERWSDEREILGRANRTDYGLAAGIWTESITRAHRLAAGLEAGIVWVNKWSHAPPGAPLGGVKASGFGRESCAETLLEYSSPKTVNVGLTRERKKLWG